MRKIWEGFLRKLGVFRPAKNAGHFAMFLVVLGLVAALLPIGDLASVRSPYGTISFPALLVVAGVTVFLASQGLAWWHKPTQGPKIGCEWGRPDIEEDEGLDDDEAA